MGERTCSKCGQVKPETEEFFRRRGTAHRGGLRPDCRKCCNQRDRAYYETNREQFRSYREANAARLAAYQASYMPDYQRSPNGKAAQRRATVKWSQTPEGRFSRALASQRRRARKVAAAGSFTAVDWSACVAAFDGCCAYCGEGGRLTQEHVVPLSAGGTNDRSNIVPACLSCNSSKFDKSLDSWYLRQPFFSEERIMRIGTYLSAVA